MNNLNKWKLIIIKIRRFNYWLSAICRKIFKTFLTEIKKGKWFSLNLKRLMLGTQEGGNKKTSPTQEGGNKKTPPIR